MSRIRAAAPAAPKTNFCQVANPCSPRREICAGRICEIAKISQNKKAEIRKLQTLHLISCLRKKKIGRYLKSFIFSFYGILGAGMCGISGRALRVN